MWFVTYMGYRRSSSTAPQVAMGESDGKTQERWPPPILCESEEIVN